MRNYILISISDVKKIRINAKRRRQIVKRLTNDAGKGSDSGVNSKNKSEEQKHAQEPFSEFSKKLGIIVSVLPLLYAISNYLFNYSYQEKCNEFYHIPGEHFTTSINKSIVCAIGLALLYFAPIVWKKLSNGKMNGWLYIVVKLILTICFGVVIGLINTVYLIELFAYGKSQFSVSLFNLCNNHQLLVAIVAMVLSSTVIYCMLFDWLWEKIASKKSKEVLATILSAFFVLSFALSCWGVFRTQYPDPFQKTSYEIVEYDENTYFVLSENQGKLLIVPYEIDSGKYKLSTSHYRIVDEEKCIYSTIELEEVPKTEDTADVQEE